jgi:hypothetical protein
VQYRRWAALARLARAVSIGAYLLLALSVIGTLALLVESDDDLNAVVILAGFAGAMLSLHILLVALYVEARAAEWRPGAQ